MAGESMFKDLQIAAPIEVFALTAEYNEEASPRKVNLGVGAYRTDEGKPWVLPVVRTVQASMAADSTLNNEYLPVAGMPDFCKSAIQLMLGEDSKAIIENRVQSFQCLGGTGAIRLCAEFLHRHLGCNKALISRPTWGNHRSIFQDAGFTVSEYTYWDDQNKKLAFDKLQADLKNADAHSVVVLHACAHNPTGVDPTLEQWKIIADICEEGKLIVLLDCAYQGFATGDLEKDAEVPQYFVNRKFEFFIAQSFSKNFGLYNERVGNLIVVANSAEDKTLAKVKTQMELIIRRMWSNPPCHGARVVCTVLSNKALWAEWKESVKTMADRIKAMRQQLHDRLRALGTPGDWDHIKDQKGMFSYTGLTESQVKKLKDKYKIFMLKSGRANMCGLTTQNVEYVAGAIHSVVTESENKL